MWHHLSQPCFDHDDPDQEWMTQQSSYGDYDVRPVVYDIGAEEGDFPALFSSWGCDVVLFEPNDRVWPNIRAIWEANQLRPPLAMFVGFAGLDDDHSIRIGKADPEWALPERNWPMAAYGEVIGDHGFKTMPEYPEIPRCSIDEMARSIRPPTAITIDVEGAEYEVLLGAMNTLKEHRPKVWVSVHHDFARDTYGMPDVLSAIQTLFEEAEYPLDPATGERGVFIASDHEDHWVWLP
jgi:FkbM family methyltransferase